MLIAEFIALEAMTVDITTTTTAIATDTAGDGIIDRSIGRRHVLWTPTTTLLSHSLANKFDSLFGLNNQIDNTRSNYVITTTTAIHETKSKINKWIQSKLSRLVLEGIVNPYVRKYTFPPIHVNVNYLVDVKKDLVRSPTERLFDRHFDGFDPNRADPIFVPGLSPSLFDPHFKPSAISQKKWWWRT